MIDYKKYDIIIGIDPGCQTGVAVWDRTKKELQQVVTLQHHKAVSIISAYVMKNKVLVRFEDARLRTWFGDAGREKLQGAGSVKRDSMLWEEWCKMYSVDFEPVAPKNNKTKMDSATFQKYTGWKGQTNEHGRDAAMLVFGL